MTAFTSPLLCAPFARRRRDSTPSFVRPLLGEPSVTSVRCGMTKVPILPWTRDFDLTFRVTAQVAPLRRHLLGNRDEWAEGLRGVGRTTAP